MHSQNPSLANRSIDPSIDDDPILQPFCKWFRETLIIIIYAYKLKAERSICQKSDSDQSAYLWPLFCSHFLLPRLYFIRPRNAKKQKKHKNTNGMEWYERVWNAFAVGMKCPSRDTDTCRHFDCLPFRNCR